MLKNTLAEIGRNLFLPDRFKAQFKPVLAETCQPSYTNNDYLNITVNSVSVFLFVFFCFQFSKSFSSSVMFSSLLLSTPIYPIIGLFLGESASL